MKTKVLIILVLCFFSCKEEKQSKEMKSLEVETNKKNSDEELKYVLNDTFKIGDVRRYGIMPNKSIGKHPVTQKNSLETLLDLAEKISLDITFPEGNYPIHLLIRGRENINIHFDNATIGGYVQITEKEDKISNNIKFTGILNIYDLLIVRNAVDTEMEIVSLLSDESKNTFKSRNKGVRIYGGVEKLEIKELNIEDLGSGKDEAYQRVHAALLVVESPKELTIDKLHIKSSDRHGVYLTGSDHIIKNIIIDKFGIGEIDNMSYMPDLIDKENTKKIVGVWLSRCNYSIIGNIVINTKNSKGKYALRLDNGNVSMPTIIESVVLKGGDTKLPIYAEETTNVVVESLEKK